MYGGSVKLEERERLHLSLTYDEPIRQSLKGATFKKKLCIMQQHQSDSYDVLHDHS